MTKHFEHPMDCLPESARLLLNCGYIESASAQAHDDYHVTDAGRLLLDVVMKGCGCPGHSDSGADIKSLGEGEITVMVKDIWVLAGIVLGRRMTDQIVTTARDLRLEEYCGSTVLIMGALASHVLRHSEPDPERRKSWTWDAGLSAEGIALFKNLLVPLLESQGRDGRKIVRIVNAVAGLNAEVGAKPRYLKKIERRLGSLDWGHTQVALKMAEDHVDELYPGFVLPLVKMCHYVFYQAWGLSSEQGWWAWLRPGAERLIIALAKSPVQREWLRVASKEMLAQSQVSDFGASKEEGRVFRAAYKRTYELIERALKQHGHTGEDAG